MTGMACSLWAVALQVSASLSLAHVSEEISGGVPLSCRHRCPSEALVSDDGLVVAFPPA